jgi:hypothetical protein
MNDPQQLESEKLVEIHRAANEWRANILVGYLRDNGIEASWEVIPSRARAALRAGYCDPDSTCRVFVLEHAADRARQLIEEYLAASPNERMLEELALQKRPMTKERFAQLRAALREERRTFRFLGLLGAAFLAAGLLLRHQVIGLAGARWIMLAVIAIAAVVVGNWLREKL